MMHFGLRILSWWPVFIFGGLVSTQPTLEELLLATDQQFNSPLLLLLGRHGKVIQSSEAAQFWFSLLCGPNAFAIRGR